jgi:hypothetical protein
MLEMRTTLTLDDDLAAKLKAVARERGISFKEAVNSVLRAGFALERGPRRYRQRTYRMELREGIDVDKALRLAAALEDEATLRKLELRK